MAASAALGLLLGWSGFGSRIDLLAYDLLSRLHSPPQPSSILLVVDEDTLEAYGGLLRIREPLARGLEIIAPHKPSAVAIDIVLSEPGEENVNAALQRALSRVPKVVLAAHLRSTAPSEASTGWQEPLPIFSGEAATLGHVHADPDADGVCRRVLLAKAAGRKRLWAMALEAYRLSLGGPPIVETESALEVGDRRIPVSAGEQRSLRIAYTSPENPIERISLKQVLEDPASASAVRGRVVFVGVVVPGGPDQFLMTPSSFGQAMSGVEINANVYETLAGGRFLVPVSHSVALLVALGYAAALGLCFVLFGGRRALWAAATLLLAAHLTPALFFLGGQVLDFAPVAAVAWTCFLAGGSHHYLRVRGRMQIAEEKSQRYQRAVHYVTHEMRTPLTTIQGSSELIGRHALPEEKRRRIAGLIHQESVRLARLVDMFLSVERLSAGELELRPETIDASALLRGCIERAEPLAERKHITIFREIETQEPIWGDRELLEYACYNLLTNAIKYSPAHTSITVRARLDRERISLAVEDRGYGMDPSEIKDIFRKFYRTPRARQLPESGTGLGLAIVEEIVAQHRGSIAVESRVNEGSRFTLSLPRAGNQEAGSAVRPKAGNRQTD